MTLPTPPPLLFSYRRCPYAMRARMALLVARIPFVIHEIELRRKPPELLEASPKGTVPVLLLADGSVCDQSWHIVSWALNHPTAAAESAAWWQPSLTPDNCALLTLNDGAFKQMLDRYKYPERMGIIEPEAIRAAKAEARLQAMSGFLIPLEQKLRTDPYLGGTKPCATDFGIFPFVRQFAAVDTTWFQTLPLPRVQSWLTKWLDSTLFKTCMHKLTPNQRQKVEPGPRSDWLNTEVQSPASK